MSRTTIDDQSILDAAALEFAEKGFGGARVDEVARRAGVNKATLYYRIGDKEALYGAVLERMLAEAADRVEQGCTAHEGAANQLRAYISAVAQSAAAHGYFAPIMMREVASGGVHLPDSALRHMGRILTSLQQVLERGQDGGQFRPANPMATHMMVIGSLMFYVAGAPLRARVSTLTPAPLGSAAIADGEAMAAQVGDLVLAAVSNSPSI